MFKYLLWEDQYGMQISKGQRRANQSRVENGYCSSKSAVTTVWWRWSWCTTSSSWLLSTTSPMLIITIIIGPFLAGGSGFFSSVKIKCSSRTQRDPYCSYVSKVVFCQVQYCSVVEMMQKIDARKSNEIFPPDGCLWCCSTNGCSSTSLRQKKKKEMHLAESRS